MNANSTTLDSLSQKAAEWLGQNAPRITLESNFYGASYSARRHRIRFSPVFLENMTEDQVHAVLAHECGHAKDHDLIVKCLKNRAGWGLISTLFALVAIFLAFFAFTENFAVAGFLPFVGFGFLKSTKHESQWGNLLPEEEMEMRADDFAKEKGMAWPLVSVLMNFDALAGTKEITERLTVSKLAQPRQALIDKRVKRLKGLED